MKKYNLTKMTILFSAGLLVSQSYAADEAALYELAPADSAYVRIINNHSDEAISTVVSEKTLKSDGYCKASDYEFVTSGDYALSLDNKTWSGQLKPNKTYTFIVNKKGIDVIEDNIFNNPKKGQFAAYNLTDKTEIAVKTKDGKKNVFPKVSHKEHVSREVNPIKIGLAIYEADKKILDADTARFQRGKSNNLFVCGSAENYLASWTEQ